MMFLQISSFGPIQLLNSLLVIKKELDKLNLAALRKNNIQGYFNIHNTGFSQISPGRNLFACTEREFINAYFLCDEHSDCSSSSDPSDESNCTCDADNKYPYCKYTTDIINKKCSQLYYRTPSWGCVPYAFQDNSSNQLQELFKCNNGRSIRMDYVNDLVSDCGTAGEDEHILLNMRINLILFVCEKPSEIPCEEGHPQCYNISDICIFVLNEDNNLTPCRTGGHVANCSSFQCNMHFKCPAGYCVPWSYICDNKWDCYSGVDEHIWPCGQARNCTTMFKCHKSVRCTHVSEVCDGRQNCPLGDDELYCSESTFTCPRNCTCLLAAISCKNAKISGETLKGLLEYAAVFLKNHSVFTVQAPQLLVSKTTKIISITHTSISECICLDLHINNALLVLILRSNSLQHLCTNNFNLLTVCDVSNNSIKSLKRCFFGNNYNLKLLNISMNPIANFEQEAFSNAAKNIHFIIFQTNLSSNWHFSLDNNIFLKMTSLKLVVTDHYQICCFLPAQTACSGAMPWFKSCNNLLPNLSLKVLFYIFSLKILILNTISILLQNWSYKKQLQRNASNGMLVGFINLTDIICSLPLFILWMSDLVYQGMFILYDHQWRSSVQCFFTFSLFLWFAICSPTSLCFLSYHRYEMVKHPIETNYKRTSFVVKRSVQILASTALLSLLLTLFTWLNVFLMSGSLPTSLCLPFVDPTQDITMVTIILSLTVNHQIACIVYIFTSYIFLVKSLHKFKESVKDAVQKKTSNVTLIVQIVLVSLTSVVCWIPSSATYIISVVPSTHSFQIIFWTTIVAFPMNSIVNPIIFCAVCLRKFFGKRKIRKNCVVRNRSFLQKTGTISQGPLHREPQDGRK